MPLPSSSHHSVVHLIVPEPPGEIGGADLHVLDLARLQMRRGILKPFVLCNTSEEYAFRLQQAHIPHAFVRSYSRRPWSIFGKVRPAVQMNSVRLLHSHGYDSDFMAWTLRQLFPQSWGNLPIVMTCHGLVEDTWWHRLKTRASLRVYRSADAVIATSQSLATRLRQEVKNVDIIRIHNGVWSADGSDKRLRCLFRAEAGIPERAYVVASIGRLAGEKRVDVFLRAAKMIALEESNVYFLIVGSGALEKWLRTRAMNIGLGDRVIFIGLQWDVEPIYNAIDVLVNSSDTETTSRVILEAMVRGVPVVATQVGGTPEIIESETNGLLVEKENAGEIATMVLRFLRSNDLRARLGQNARAKVLSGLTLERMFHRTECLYRKLLELTDSPMNEEGTEP